MSESNTDRNWRRARGALWGVRGAAAVAVWCVLSAPLFAQAPPPGGRIVGGGKSYVIEGVATVLLSALAIFAVGRTGRRN